MSLGSISGGNKRVFRYIFLNFELLKLSHLHLLCLLTSNLKGNLQSWRGYVYYFIYKSCNW